jgi:hypothetical protein
MITLYSPKDINQSYFLIIFPNGVFLLTETNLEKQQPMYMGKDRIKVEAILKEIKKEAAKQKTQNTKLFVYELSQNGLKHNLQSPFNNILSSI